MIVSPKSIVTLSCHLMIVVRRLQLSRQFSGSFRHRALSRTRVWSTIRYTNARRKPDADCTLNAELTKMVVRNDTAKKYLQGSAVSSLSFWCNNRVASVIMRRANSLYSLACSPRSSVLWCSEGRSEGPHFYKAAGPLIVSHSLWPVRFEPYIRSKEYIGDSYL